MKPQKLLDSSYFEGPKQLDSKKQAKLKVDVNSFPKPPLY